MRLICLLSLAVLTIAGQDFPLPPAPNDVPEPKLPNGKSQHEAILKEDYRKNVEDAAQLARLSQELKDDLDKDDAHVVSVKTLKKLDDIERLAKNIRGRLKRY
jgi:hypothetical protein